MCRQWLQSIGSAIFDSGLPEGTKIFLYFVSDHDVPVPLIVVGRQCRQEVLMNKQAMRFAVFDHSDASIVSSHNPSIEFSDERYLEKRLLALRARRENVC